MEVLDIMIPASGKDNDRIVTTAVLSCEQDILTLSDISTLPPVIGVKNQEGQIIGYVERDTLIFLGNTCEKWVFGQIADRFQEGVIAIDSNSRIFYVNDTYSKIIGIAKHNVLGRLLKEIEPGAAMLSVLESGEPILGKAVHIKTVNHDVIVNISPINHEGKLVAVVSIFRDVTETKQMRRALDRAHELAEYLRQQLTEQDDLEKNNIVGQHPSFVKAISQAIVVAKTDAPVLLAGESGVGKEVLAVLIHQKSSRIKKPLITVNCAAIPENLLESELFGYEEGSFTGAKRGGKLGKFELAEGGTIFLDEIGDMPPIMQSKILRVLQEKEVEKIGRSQNVPVDVRIIAATNRPLEQMVKEGKFRSDLYYRLNVVSIKIPPLRERGEDVWLLANSFLKRYNTKYNKKLAFSSEVTRFFYQYDWPGNVRELQNCIEHVVIMCPEEEMLLEHMPAHMNNGIPNIIEANFFKSSNVSPLRDGIHSTEKELIEKALIACKNNRSQAMKLLRISRRAFYQKLQKYNLL